MNCLLLSTSVLRRGSEVTWGEEAEVLYVERVGVTRARGVLRVGGRHHAKGYVTAESVDMRVGRLKVHRR